MHVTSIQIADAPGLPHGLDLSGFAPGLNLLVGPNASGKSTAGRALLASLGLGAPDPHVHAVLRWHDRDADHTASVFHGQVIRSFEAAPSSPGSDAPWTLTLRDLLVADDADFARQMVTELHAGYDLAALTSGYEAEVRQPRALRRDLDEARRRDAEIAGTHRALAADETRLAALDEEIRAAAEARDAVDALDIALHWHAQQSRVDEARARVDGFGALHARIPAGFADRLADRDDAVTRAERDERTARGTLADARDARDALGDKATATDPATVQALTDRADALARLTERASDAASGLAAADAALQAQRERTGLGEGAETPDRDALDALDALVREEAAAIRRHDEAQAAADLAPSPADDADDPEPMGEAVVVLRQWLATAPTSANASDARSDRPVAIVAIVAIVAALIVLLVGFATGGAAAGVAGAVALAIVAVLAWPRGDGAATTGTPPVWTSPVDGPEAWTVEAVSRRLLEVHEAHGRSSAARARFEAARTQHAQAAHRLEDAAGRAAEATRAVDDWFASRGIGDRWPRTSAVERAHRLHAIADAAAAREAAAARHADARRALDDAWGSWAAAVEAAGTTWTGARDVVEARALAQRVGGLAEAVRDAIREVEQAEGAVRQAERAHTRARQDRQALFAAAEFADDEHDAVRAALSRHAEWVDADRAWRDAVREADALRARLGDDALLDVAPDDLTAQRQGAEARVQAHDALTQERAELQERVRRALGGSERADTGDAVAQAGAALADRRDEALVSSAAAAMSRWVTDTLDQTAVPDTLKRAQDRFAAFTRGAWALVLRPDRSLGARDAATSAVRGLEALSDATRVQLLLATRIARIEAGEAGTPLPLFIDEALTTTDPQRFHAVADALATLADEGRQVIYATANAADVAAWQAWSQQRDRTAPAVVYTGAAAPSRGWPQDLPAAPPTPTPIPAPEASEDPAHWFARAGVPTPRVHEPASSWPAAMLLYDRLDDAATLLHDRVTTAGHATRLIEAGASWLPLDDDTRRLFATRARMLDATLAAAEVGRNRPVTWDMVLESGAVTQNFETRMRALLVDHGDDAAAYVAAVRGLSHFRPKTADGLEAHLRDTGRIDDRDPLDDDEIVGRARTAVGDDPTVRGGDVEAFVTWVLDLLGRTDGSPGDT